jgi:3-hydroxyisobutyryl-CoA hydrolase
MTSIFIVGGGGMLGGTTPFRVATENASFTMPETKIGSFNDASSGYFLSRMEYNLGRFLGLTGITIKAEDVL